ncbi:MAG TPA: hypothetical protein VIX35_05085 [Vicinamibacterales bacterium]
MSGLVVAALDAPVNAQAVDPSGAATAPSTPPSGPPASAAGMQGGSGQAARWEVEGYGGFSNRIVSTGSAVLPAAGAPITTSNPTLPSRQTPSWFFGDGSALLNGALEDLGLTTRITPLDSALASLGFGDSGAAGGIRVRRSITPRLSAELSLDVLTGSPVLTSAFSAAIESSRASFGPAFTSLFSTGPFSSATASATAVTANGSGQQAVGTGSIRVPFAPRFHLVPYLSFGGGVLTRRGQLPSATITGNYQALAPTGVPINETDRVVVRYSQGIRAVAVLGAGVRRAVSSHWGVDLDARLFVGPQPVTLLLDANPSVAQGQPAGFIESSTYPSIQFSNNVSTGRSSSLSGPALQGFTAFSGGIQMHALVTLGVYVRF